ncbi:MAG TPA: phage tail protein, partial [Candidatus Limnocylindrales bacterium]|nr:phage tail protein [Candidatus Limnocylindrales bacterium]
DFAQSMMSGLDEVLAPVVSTIDNIDAYLDPYLTPEDFLTWLGGWVGLAIDETWTIERRREAVGRAVELYRRRGTALGLEQQIEIHTGGTVEIIENGGTAWSIDPGGEMPGSPKPLVVVRVHVDDPKSIDPVRLDALVGAAKPAHVEHRVEIVRAGKAPKGGAAAAAANGGSAEVPPEAQPPAAGSEARSAEARSAEAPSAEARSAEAPSAEAPSGAEGPPAEAPPGAEAPHDAEAPPDTTG